MSVPNPDQSTAAEPTDFPAKALEPESSREMQVVRTYNAPEVQDALNRELIRRSGQVRNEAHISFQRADTSATIELRGRITTLGLTILGMIGALWITLDHGHSVLEACGAMGLVPLASIALLNTDKDKKSSS